jgi:hypothetical protein
MTRRGRGSSSGIRQLGCEADYLLPTSAELKSDRSCISIPPYTFVPCRGTTSSIFFYSGFYPDDETQTILLRPIPFFISTYQNICLALLYDI